MQLVPMGGFIGMDHRAGRHALGDGFNGLAFRLEHERERPTATLAHDDHDAALAGLVLGKATVNAVLDIVRGADMTTEIGAINLDRAGDGHVLHFGRHGFTELVSQDEGSLVLHIQIAGELQGTMALGAVDEDRDGEEVVADRELAAGEDGPGCDRELMRARLALVELAGLVGEGFSAGAARAYRLAVRVRPADQTEGVMGFLVRHAGNLRQRERAGCGGKKEVLRHVRANDFRWPQ